MSVDSTKLAAVRPQVVFSRMTSAEVSALLLARGDIASIPGGIPTRLRFDAILAWFEYNQGNITWNDSAFTPSLLLTGTAAQVKDAIFAQFETGRLTFLTMYGFSASRVTELIETDAVNVAGAPLDTKVPVWAQPSDSASFSKQNLVTKATTFWASGSSGRRPHPVSGIVNQLAAQPPGMRTLHVAQITAFANAAGNYLLYDDAVDPVNYPQTMPWFDIVQTDDASDWMTIDPAYQGMTLVEIWEDYFADLKAACDAIHITIDWLMLDLEDVRYTWQFEADDWDAILADPRRAALETALGFSLGANGAAIVADWAGVSVSHGNPKAWRFNTWMTEQRMAHMAALLEKFTDNFPTARRTEYETHYKASRTYPTDQVLARGRPPMSAGLLVGDADCFSSIHCYGDSISNGRAALFPRTGVVTPPYVPGNGAWEGFLLDHMNARSVLAADNGSRMAWVLAFTSYSLSGYNGSPLYTEIIHHLRVMGYDLFAWSSAAQEQKPLSDALIESDSVLQYAGWIPDVPDEPGADWFNSLYVASSCDSAGVRKYRITPKSGSTYSADTSGGVFSLTVNGSVVLSLPRVSSATLTGAGYWVTQTNPVVPDAPATVGFSMGLLGILFGAVAIALGEKKWPRDTTLTKSGPGGTSFTRVGPADTALTEQT